MSLSKKSSNPTKKRPYHLICECLRETNELGKEKFSENLRNRKGMMSKIRLFLFLHPYFCFVTPVIIFGLILFGITFLVRNLEFSYGIRLVLILIFISLYAAFLISLQWLTPKFDMSFNERWGGVVGCYLRKTGLNLAQAERDIKRDIQRYKREGLPFLFFVNLLWGGIFVGCLPDPEFQKALMTMPFEKIFDANPFGAACMVLAPFIYTFYFIKYDFPIAGMEYVIDQIELEK
jgi:hypothetical protein